VSKKRENNDILLYRYLVEDDNQAYERLVQDNMKLVYFVLYKKIAGMLGMNNEQVCEEYYDVGCIGLIKAIKSFNKDNIGKVSFSTYANVCIYRAILCELRRQNKSIKCSVSLEDLSFDNSDQEYKDGVEDISADIDEIAYKNYKKDKVLQVINKLDDLKKNVLIDYFGFREDGVSLNQAQIAEKYNFTKSYICLIIKRSLAKIEKELKEFKNDYKRK